MPTLKLLENAKPVLPHLEDVSPKFVELRDKANSIGLEIDALRKRQRALADTAKEARNAAKGEGGSNASAEVHVAKSLGRQPVELAARRDIDKDIQDIGRDIKDREAALAVLNREIEIERRAASSIVMRSLEPQYRDLVSKICKSLLELHEANLRYNEFADHMNFRGISWSGVPGMPLWFLGHPNDPGGNLASYLREAVESGFMKASDFPSEFRYFASSKDARGTTTRETNRSRARHRPPPVKISAAISSRTGGQVKFLRGQN